MDCARIFIYFASPRILFTTRLGKTKEIDSIQRSLWPQKPKMDDKFYRTCPKLVQHKLQGYRLGCLDVGSKDKVLCKAKSPHAYLIKPKNFLVLNQELKNSMTEGLVQLC